jgi:hypothetical protein
VTPGMKLSAPATRHLSTPDRGAFLVSQIPNSLISKRCAAFATSAVTNSASSVKAFQASRRLGLLITSRRPSLEHPTFLPPVLSS